MTVADECLLGIGVDGAPGGWVAACCFAPDPDVAVEQRRSEPRFFTTIAAVVEWRANQPGGPGAPVAVDIPIGLPETVCYRPCDREARGRLGERRNSVFQPPARYLLSAAEPVDGKPPKAKQVFARVQELVAARKDAAAAEAAAAGAAVAEVLGLSQQGAGILLKVAEVDAFLLAERAPDGRLPRQEWLFEVHPELSVIAMNSGAALPRKATAHGQLQRLDLVRAQFPDAEQRVRAWEGGARYSLLDICDAYAACWTALRFARTSGGTLSQRGDVTPALEVIGEEAPGRSPVEQTTGLGMRMVV
jgi:predicted RNase H-like nuclease